MATWPISPSGSVDERLGHPWGEPGGHIVLVGLPGSGKSTVGPLLATALHRPFLDFDDVITGRAGMSISRLFAELGEVAFRARERALTEELRGREPMVLAPGGGWITQPESVKLLRPPARFAYLKSAAAAALARMGSGVADRPLLAVADPIRALESLLDTREPLYEAADWTVEVDSVDPQRVANEIAAQFHRWTEGQRASRASRG
jgi:shikimate kinase